MENALLEATPNGSEYLGNHSVYDLSAPSSTWHVDGGAVASPNFKRILYSTYTHYYYTTIAIL